jgi:choline-sulfatase
VITWRGVAAAAVALLLCVQGWGVGRVAGASARQPNAVPAARPNIVMIVTDDQAAWALGASGNTDARTPVMDRLAAEGVRFVNAFTPTPVCSPSRATLLTGRYGTEVGITDWISPAEADAGVGLPPETITWAEVLRDAGYRTGLVGKWHLGSRPEFHPTRHGYEWFLGFLGGGTTPMRPRLEVDGVDREMEGATPDVLTDAALAFIERHQREPFALSVHYRAPHTPYGPVPPQDMAPFADAPIAIPDAPGIDQAQVRRWTREYYASIHSVDRNVGRLLETLSRLGLDERTVVVFTSDHGYNIGHHGLHSKGNGIWIAGGVNGPNLPNMYEESIRLPLIVRGAGVQNAGRIVRAEVTFEDLYPTVLALAGAELPAGAPRHGRDLTPWLRDDPVADWRDAVFGQYDMHHYTIAHLRMIRTARWKLVRAYGTTTRDQLFDLESDPGERTNLYNTPAHRATRAALEARLRAWMREVDDPLLRETGLLYQPAP